MERNYPNRSEYSSSTITLAVLTAVFGALCVFVADIFVPVVSAMLAVLFLSERGKRKKLFLIVSGVIVVSNIVVVALAAFTGFFVYSISALHIIALSVVLCVLFSRNRPKSEIVAALSLITVLFFAVSLWLISFSYTGSFSLSEAFNFYKAAFASVKEEILLIAEQAAESVTDGALADAYAEETVLALIDGFISVLPALVILLAVFYTGVVCKVFSFAVYRTTGNPRIYEWRFTVSSLFAYFYCAIFLAFVFLSGISATFSLIISNLFIVFMPIFAYFGFGFATALFSLRYSRGFSWSVLIVLMLVFSAITFIVLSFFGVVFIILHNKHASVIKNGGV